MSFVPTATQRHLSAGSYPMSGYQRHFSTLHVIVGVNELVNKFAPRGFFFFTQLCVRANTAIWSLIKKKKGRKKGFLSDIYSVLPHLLIDKKVHSCVWTVGSQMSPRTLFKRSRARKTMYAETNIVRRKWRGKYQDRPGRVIRPALCIINDWWYFGKSSRIRILIPQWMIVIPVIYIDIKVIHILI